MTPFQLAQRFVGEIRELPGSAHHPFIQFGHLLCGLGPETPDEVAWCSSFANAVCWILRAPRSKSAAARSWLRVGEVVELRQAEPGWDIVILKRGTGPGASSALDPQVDGTWPPGHVGFFAGYEQQTNKVYVVGGNQSDAVTVAAFDAGHVLGVRRLSP